MATIHQVLVISQDAVSADIQRDLYAEAGLVQLAGLKIKDYLKKCLSGHKNAVVQTKINSVKATGAITLSAHAATNTVTINGVVLTAGTDYAVGGTDTITASNLATAINANATLDGMLVATSSGAVVTLTALLPGEIGNAVTLAISAGGSVSAARMAGGTNGDTETTHNFGSAS